MMKIILYYPEVIEYIGTLPTLERNKIRKKV